MQTLDFFTLALWTLHAVVAGADLLQPRETTLAVGASILVDGHCSNPRSNSDLDFVTGLDVRDLHFALKNRPAFVIDPQLE